MFSDSELRSVAETANETRVVRRTDPRSFAFRDSHGEDGVSAARKYATARDPAAITTPDGE